jgi:carbonic anhydrase
MPSKEIKATDFPLLQTCLTDNKEWAEKVHVDDPEFFSRSAKGQSPFLLWIGCTYRGERGVQSCADGSLAVSASLVCVLDTACPRPLASFVRSSAPGADSRVPESVVLGRKPGEIFVHRNIANQFHHNDDSANAVLTYAVKHLGVQHGESSLKSGEGGETREEDRRMSDYVTGKSSDDFFYRIPRTTPI